MKYEVNYNDDNWRIPCEDKSLGNYFHFDFTHIPSQPLKNQFKDYFIAGIKRGFVEISTLHRYCYALLRFTNFLKEAKVEVNYFSDLTGNIIDMFIMFLKSVCNSSSTMILSYVALKQSVRYGQNLGLDQYPKREIFPMETTRIFDQDDTIKTRLFSDEVAFKLEDAIDKENDIYLKTLVMIAYETGLRLSEILNIDEGSVLTDFVGTPLLFTQPFKSKEERCVPITEKCADQIYKLEEYTKDFRVNRKVFSVKYIKKSGSHIAYQADMRKTLKRFLQKK